MEMLYPRHHDQEGGGTFLMPNTVAMVEGTSRREEARALLEFLLSDDTARRLASSFSGNVPLQPSVAAAFPDLVVEDPLEVDLAAASGVGPEVIRRTVETLRNAEPQP